jgi:protein SCO1
MERKVLLAGAILLAVVLIAAAVSTWRAGERFQGAIISPAPQAADFVNLHDQKGQLVQLEDLKGRIVLVFFGYTHCPDECPTTLARLKQMMEMLGVQAKDVTVIMVTTDPARDTAEVMGGYLANFNPGFLGLRGNPSDLEKTWNAYGVTVLNNGETHSARVYVIDREGKLRITFPSELASEGMAADVRLLLGEK